jgi:hypothetical protein
VEKILKAEGYHPTKEKIEYQIMNAKEPNIH